MTFAPPDVSRVGARRIGVANAVIWIAGSIVLVVVGATAAYSFVVAPYTGGGILGIDNNPWEAENPIVATESGDVWSADASGVIRIPAAQFTVPREAMIVEGGDAMLYRTDPDEQPAYEGDVVLPQYIGYIYDDEAMLIVPTGDDLELWVAAGQAWQIRLAPIEATVMGDEGASGTEDAYLIYRGSAVSANFVYIGDGIFFVSIYTAFSQDIPIIETGDHTERLSWDPDDYVVFEVESTDGAWTIDIDQLASSTPAPTPTPTPTPSPTETP
jgi:hypothetical protein